jgi:hypothetical protein
MYILCLQGKENEGAYALQDDTGAKSLLMFLDEDDAERYLGMLEADDYPPLTVVEVDDENIIDMCENMGNSYTIIGPDELIIPPQI